MVQSGEKCLYLNPNHIIICNMRFLGNIEAKIDAKGRAFLPASFRKVLTAGKEETLILRQDIFERCLVIYPESVWNDRMDEMRAHLSRWDREEQMVFRTFVSRVSSLTMDGHGRILLPKAFIEAACIGQNVRFVGMGDTIEIWAVEGNVDKGEPFMPKADFAEAISKIMAKQGVGDGTANTHD